MYSQRDEQKHILNAVSSLSNGTFLDIGAFHPEKFSNTRALFELGWSGVMVEPAPDLADNLRSFYSDSTNIQIVEVAVGTENKTVVFFDSHGDAIGTTVSSHADLWRRDYNVPYDEIEVSMVTYDNLLALCDYDTFDFISLDIEGADLDVFKTMDLDKTQTKCVCVEWNGSNKNEFTSVASNFGMVLVHETAENLIFAR